MHIETLGNDTTSCLTALRIYNSNPDRSKFLSTLSTKNAGRLHSTALDSASSRQEGAPSAFSTICNAPTVMYICPFLFWMPPHSDKDSEGEHSTRLRPWFEAVALHAFASTWSMTTNPI